MTQSIQFVLGQTLKFNRVPAGRRASSVIQGFGRGEPAGPRQAAALRVAERAAAKRLLTAPVHFGQAEDSLLEEPSRASSLVPGCRAGLILSIPRNERLMVQPYIQSMRPLPRR